MPADLQTLLDQYGGEAAAGHYGVQVLETVDSVMGNEGVRQNISPITTATIATLEVAAYEVLTGGADLEALAGLAVKTAMDLAGQIATEALGAVGSAVPIMGSAFKVILSLQEAAKEQARAERIAEARRSWRSCMATAERFEPIGSGPYHEIYPCDLFLRAEKLHGGWSTTTPPTVPYLGQMLQLMTENRWPGWALHFCRMYGGPAASHAATWGYQDGPIWKNLMGSSDWPFSHRLPEGRDWFPELDWYIPEFQRLRRAVRSMHPYQRQIDGFAESGDGGKSLWGIYQDLLYAVLYVDRHPFTAPGQPSFPIKDHANFSAWVPPLPRDAAQAIYGSDIDRNVDGEPSGLGQPRIFRALEYIRSQGGAFPGGYHERKITYCGGQPTKAIDAIYNMAGGWNLWTHPEHYTDQQAQQNAIGQSAAFASEFTRERLRQLGVTGTSDGGPAAARRTIGKLAAGGVITPDQADEVAGAVNGGADSGSLALLLGASAVGVGALAWMVS